MNEQVLASKKFLVSIDDEIEHGDVVFFVRIGSHVGDPITLEIDGGFAQDHEGNWWEVQANFVIRELFANGDFVESRNQEFEVVISLEDVREAQKYRQYCPANPPGELPEF